jgi:uncharacterized protein (TIGR02677 family)
LQSGIHTDSEAIARQSAFQMTERLPIFSYLVTTNRVNWYRRIMQIFLRHHRDLYHYQLTAQELRDEMRTSFDSEYTLEQCQNDLIALKDWGNLTTIYDSSRATSIASFLSPALLYQATPEAIALETFLAEQSRLTAAQGALRQGDLSRLWHALQAIDEALSFTTELESARMGELAEEWRRAFEIWNSMAREAAQYLANMLSAAQQTHADLITYQTYKGAVVAYVHGFAQALTQYGPRIRELLDEWTKTQRKEQFIAAIAHYLEPPALANENQPTDEELQQEVHNQFEAMIHWFAQGRNADSFRRNALAEVDKVVRRAAVLAATARPNANYATQLNALAQQLLKASNGEHAQQLFSIAFANLQPLHFPEGLAGQASALYEENNEGAWQQPVSNQVYLHPVSRGFRGEHAMEDPIADNRVLIQNLLAQHEQKIQEQRARFQKIFHKAEIDIGNLKKLTPEDRALLTSVIDSCLSNSAHQYQAPDGTIIVLLNPDETTFVLLRARDGILILPRYRLARLEALSIPSTPSETGNTGGSEQ